MDSLFINAQSSLVITPAELVSFKAVDAAWCKFVTSKFLFALTVPSTDTPTGDPQYEYSYIPPVCRWYTDNSPKSEFFIFVF